MHHSRFAITIGLVFNSFAAYAPAQGAPATATPRAAAPDELSQAEYAARRARLARLMDDGVLVALGSRPPSADYQTFFQNSPFRYLTGLLEPGSALVMVKAGDRLEQILFVPRRDPAREVWEGARLGTEAAARLVGIQARPASQLMATVDSLLTGASTLYTLFPGSGDEVGSADSTAAQRELARRAARRSGVRVREADALLNRLRATKSPAEVEQIRRAVEITNLAHREAIRAVEPGMNEFEVQALIEYTFRRNGAERPSFASIVGSGPNSTTLHYNRDDRFMDGGDMLVMDIGASYAGYAADVTRSVPVSGTFSREQRAIYEIVLAAQKAAEGVARPGASWGELNGAANQVLAAGLTRLGLIESPTATFACERGGQRARCPQLMLFYMHGLGHGIGLDVHDPDQSYFGPFAVGSAFTIEPGVYVRADALDHLPDTPENQSLVQRLRPAVQRYRNIGVRIEDDYVITASGMQRLSAGAPREIAELEALLRESSPANRDRRAEWVEWYRGARPQ